METNERKRRLPEWLVKLFIWCVPALALAAALTCVPGLILDWDTLPTLCLILLLGLMVTRLIFLFRSHRTVWAKIWRIVVWLALMFALLFVGPFFPIKLYRSTRTDAQSRFEASVARVLPDALSAPLELGSPKTVVLHRYVESVAIWTNRSDTLLCQYDAGDYAAAKAALEVRYSFRTEPMDTEYSYQGKEVAQVEPYVRIGDDCFRFLLPADGDAQDGWDGAFYKRCLMVMTNDVEHEIGFILFYDIDLDEAHDLTEFLNEWCGWKYIR